MLPGWEKSRAGGCFWGKWGRGCVDCPRIAEQSTTKRNEGLPPFFFLSAARGPNLARTDSWDDDWTFAADRRFDGGAITSDGHSVAIRLFSFLARFLSEQKSYAMKRQPFSIYYENFALGYPGSGE